MNPPLLPLILFIAVVPARSDSLEQSLREQRFGTALKMADEAIKEHPADPRLLTARGLALDGLKRTGESLRSFEAALQVNPDFVPALKGAAQTAYGARDHRAARFLKRLIELNPRDRTAQSMAGVLAFESGDCASAAAHFEAGREESTTNPEASALYGDCLVKLRRAPEAVTVFERLWRQGDPPNTAVLRSLASAQAAAGTPELAASTLARALEIVREEQSYVDLAALCIVNNAPQRALASIEAGLAEWPRSARLYSLRGVVEAEGGKPADAERDFGFANQLDPKGQYGSAGLGVLYTDTGRAEEASAVLRQRLQKEPSDATLSYLLAQALTREGAAPGSSEFREAQEALVKATRTRPGFVAAHTALGKLLRQSGDEARALAEFELALKLDGSDRTALNQLAALLRRAGRVQEAEQAAATLRELVVGSGAKD